MSHGDTQWGFYDYLAEEIRATVSKGLQVWQSEENHWAQVILIQQAWKRANIKYQRAIGHIKL